MIRPKDQPMASRVAILQYLENGIWQSKGWIRRKLVADGYNINPFDDDWLQPVLNTLVREHKLYRRKNGMYHEYRLNELRGAADLPLVPTNGVTKNHQ